MSVSRLILLNPDSLVAVRGRIFRKRQHMKADALICYARRVSYDTNRQTALCATWWLGH